MIKRFYGIEYGRFSEDMVSGTVDMDKLTEMVELHKKVVKAECGGEEARDKLWELWEQLAALENACPIMISGAELYECEDFSKGIMTESYELGFGDSEQEAKLNFCQLLEDNPY